jgi:hypothetical protein
LEDLENKMKLVTNIEKLKILTESLIDRDAIRIRLLSLFDKFCNDFPIPMNAWIVDENLKIISKQGTLMGQSSEETYLDKIFEGDARVKNIEMHRKALRGEIVTYILTLTDKVLLTKLIPSDSKLNIVFGVSMDVTSFAHMSEALESSCENIESSECEIIEKVRNDTLYKILKEEGLIK